MDTLSRGRDIAVVTFRELIRGGKFAEDKKRINLLGYAKDEMETLKTTAYEAADSVNRYIDALDELFTKIDEVGKGDTQE